MAIKYKIKEETLWFEFYIDVSGTWVLKYFNPRNDLTVDFENNPAGYCHFKTSNGALILGKQEVLAEEVMVVDINDNEFLPSTPQALYGYLDDIHYFDWYRDGGGGSGTIDRFDELLDTFNYAGKAGHVPIVNPSQNALISTFLYNYALITQHSDWGDTNPLQSINNGKKVVQQDVGGQPKLVLVNDTSNSPIPPNALLNDFTPTQDGDDWTLPALRQWRIDGTVYESIDEFVQEIPPAGAGMIRNDIFYVTSDNDIHYIMGDEGSISAPIPPTPVPANSITAVVFTVTEEATTPNTSPEGNPWVTKASYGFNEVYATGSVNLPRNERTHYRVWEAADLIGIQTAYTGSLDDPNYAGQMFYVTSRAVNVVMKNEDAAGQIKFRFPSGSDYAMQLGETLQFFFVPDILTMDFVGTLGGGGSEVDTFEEGFTWNTGDPLTFSLMDGQKAMVVWIDKTPIYQTDLEWEQNETDLELDASLEGVYLFDGSKIKVSGIVSGGVAPPEEGVYPIEYPIEYP